MARWKIAVLSILGLLAALVVALVIALLVAGTIVSRSIEVGDLLGAVGEDRNRLQLRVIDYELSIAVDRRAGVVRAWVQEDVGPQGGRGSKQEVYRYSDAKGLEHFEPGDWSAFVQRLSEYRHGVRQITHGDSSEPIWVFFSMFGDAFGILYGQRATALSIAWAEWREGRGSEAASDWLGKLYVHGRGAKVDYGRAKAHLVRGARRGWCSAMTTLMLAESAGFFDGFSVSRVSAIATAGVQVGCGECAYYMALYPWTNPRLPNRDAVVDQWLDRAMQMKVPEAFKLKAKKLVEVGTPKAMGDARKLVARAAEMGSIEAQILLGNWDKEPFPGYESPMIRAVEMGDLDAVEALLQDPRVDRFEMNNALAEAVVARRARIAEVLVRAGAQLNPLGKELEDDPLGSIVIFRRENAARRLLEAGVDPNRDKDSFGNPLVSALRNRDRRTVSVLLEHGADPDLQLENGDTIRAFAERNGRAELLAQGPSRVH